MSTPSAYEITEIRGVVAGLLADTATVRRASAGAEPAPGYEPAMTWPVVATIPCRFPVPIAGSVLGHVPGAGIDIVQRRYGLICAQNAGVLEGDQIGPVIDLTGRQLNVRPMKVDAVVLRSTHMLVVLEEYGVT
ncbi:MAG TPA: hypothetical protein DEU95_06280 [Chloroflexi bacterium]|nr:hypothetical protein [Chloroflexota bacterium]HCG29343.1 hypothetical protein [Chloroflexota bacterium]